MVQPALPESPAETTLIGETSVDPRLPKPRKTLLEIRKEERAKLRAELKAKPKPKPKVIIKRGPGRPKARDFSIPLDINSPPGSPWMQRPLETDLQFAAFEVYLLLGPGRSVVQAYQIKAERPGVQAPGNWHEWCTYNRWVERAKLYDDDGDRREIAQRSKALSAFRIRMEVEQAAWNSKLLETSKLLLDKAWEMLSFALVEETIQRDGRTIVIKPAKWSMSQVAEFLKVANELAQQAFASGEDGHSTDPRVTVLEQAARLGLSNEETQAALLQLDEMLSRSAPGVQLRTGFQLLRDPEENIDDGDPGPDPI